MVRTNFSRAHPPAVYRAPSLCAVLVTYSKTGFSSGYPAYITATSGSSAGDPFGDGQAKARTCSGGSGWECPWTCYQILIRKAYTGEDLTGQETCFDTCVWASVRACTHSHTHCFSLATVHLCRTARVTTADQRRCVQFVPFGYRLSGLRKPFVSVIVIAVTPIPVATTSCATEYDFDFTPVYPPVPCFTLSLSG